MSLLKGDEVENDALLAALNKLTAEPQVETASVEEEYYPEDEGDNYDFGVNVAPAPEFPTLTKKKKKAKVADGEKKPKTKTFKADKMANGFVFQANPLAEGKEPFYMEAYLLGNNEIYISGGMAGLLNGDEAKQLRKQIKMLLTQLEQSYPDPDKEKGGKVTLKVDAPWIPTEHQLTTVAEMVKKETKKVLEKVDVDLDYENILEFIQVISLHTATTVLAQLKYDMHDPQVASPLALEGKGTPVGETSLAELAAVNEISPAPAMTVTVDPETGEAEVELDKPKMATNESFTTAVQKLLGDVTTDVKIKGPIPKVTDEELQKAVDEITAEDDTLLKALEEIEVHEGVDVGTFDFSKIDKEAMLKTLTETDNVTLAAAAGLGISASNTATLYEDDEEVS